MTEYFSHKVTFYDNSGHIVGFDWSMLDVREEQIRFCGYIKNATDDSADAGNGIPAKDCGPIVGWWAGVQWSQIYKPMFHGISYPFFCRHWLVNSR